MKEFKDKIGGIIGMSTNEYKQEYFLIDIEAMEKALKEMGVEG